MSNFLLPNPTGEDFFIQGMQSALYNRLCTVWGVDDSSYNCFGRAYRRRLMMGNSPSWMFSFYNPEAQQYVGGLNSNNGFLFFEDTMAVVSFLITGEIKEQGGIATVKSQLVFFVDLSKITPGGLTIEQQAGQRLDEVAINDVKKLLQGGRSFNHTITGDERGLDKVLKDYAWPNKNQAMIQSSDKQLMFAIDLNLNYNPKLNRGNVKTDLVMPTLIPQSLKLYIVDSPDPNSKIQVGLNKWIQKEYAPCDILSVQEIGDGNSFLAGRKVLYPFIYDNGNMQEDEGQNQYSDVTGLWDRTGFGEGPTGFLAGDKVTITVLVNQFN